MIPKIYSTNDGVPIQAFKHTIDIRSTTDGLLEHCKPS